LGASLVSIVDKGEGWQDADTPGSTKLHRTVVSGRAIRVNGNFGVTEFEWRDTQLRRVLIASAALRPLV
jgi:hypothetical protein